MRNFETLKFFFFTWLYKIREFFENHYSYELEGFSFRSGQTSIVYKVKGKYHAYKKNIAEAVNDQIFLSSFSPLNVKQICKQYYSELAVSDFRKYKNIETFIPTRFTAQKHKFLPFLAMLYIVVLIVAIILCPNIVKVGSLTEPGGILLFPLTYLIADIISEVYGYKVIRLIIWSSLACLIIATIGISISLLLPTATGKTYHEYIYVFGNMPRLLLANGLSIVISDFSNAYLFSKLKIITHGKYLWLRVIGASAIGEIAYTIIWITIFFVSQLSPDQMLLMAIQNYFFKVVYSTFFIPITYVISILLKKAEGIDIYDHNISYNIFSTKIYEEEIKKD